MRLKSHSTLCKSGRYRVRTCDLLRVKETRYHCANRPLREVFYRAVKTSSRSFFDLVSGDKSTFRVVHRQHRVFVAKKDTHYIEAQREIVLV